MIDWLRRHPLVWRVTLGLVAAGLGSSALFLFALGSCHDSGGFCSSEYSSTHTESYASAAVLAAIALPSAVAIVTRRALPLLTAAIAGGGIVVLLAALYESG